jgi:hypothetical protein
MSWLEKTPWLSLFILCTTYAVFGWSIASSVDTWIHLTLETVNNIGWFLEEQLIVVIIHLLALGVIILISLFLTTPVAFITFFVQESISSDLKAVIAIFLWSFLAVLIFCFWNIFSDLLVMVSAGILAKLDLQKLGYKTWQVFFMIVILAFFSFGVGVVSFEMKENFIFS